MRYEGKCDRCSVEMEATLHGPTIYPVLEEFRLPCVTCTVMRHSPAHIVMRLVVAKT